MLLLPIFFILSSLALFLPIDGATNTNSIRPAAQKARIAAPTSKRRQFVPPKNVRRQFAAASPRRLPAKSKFSPAASPPILAKGPGSGKSVSQCLCSDIKPCKERYMSALGPCIDACQNIVKPLGGNMQQLWQCFKQRESVLRATVSCTESRYQNACANKPGFVVPQRYNQNLQIMATAEIDKMITKMGLQKEARPFLSTGKKLFECVKGCMNKRSGNCEKALKCGLALPSDKELVQGAKQCAMNGGFNTDNAQQLCRCALAAGVKNLNNNLCSRVIIN